MSRLSETIQQRRWSWLGHVLRIPPTHCPELLSVEYPRKNGTEGRPKEAWRRTVLKNLMISLTTETAHRVGADRARQRSLGVTASTRKRREDWESFNAISFVNFWLSPIEKRFCPCMIKKINHLYTWIITKPTKALKGHGDFQKKSEVNRYNELCNPFSRISNSCPRINNSFPRIGQLVPSDCNSFPRIRQLVFSNCNPRERVV